MIPVSFVTPSTICAISSPNCSRTSSSEAEVSSTVSCSSAAQSVVGVEPHPGADPRDADGVRDEVLAGAAALVGVVLAGEHERRPHPLAVDLDRGSAACSATTAKRSSSSCCSLALSASRSSAAPVLGATAMPLG